MPLRTDTVASIAPVLARVLPCPFVRKVLPLFLPAFFVLRLFTAVVRVLRQRVIEEVEDDPRDRRRLIRKRLECDATWVRATPGSCACGEETTDAAHELLHCELLEEIRQPFLQALANFRQKALLTGKRLTDEEAAQWITTGDPRIPYTPGLPESGAALRAAALALSAKAIAIQAQRLKELRAASQIN